MIRGRRVIAFWLCSVVSVISYGPLSACCAMISRWLCLPMLLIADQRSWRDLGQRGRMLPRTRPDAFSVAWHEAKCGQCGLGLAPNAAGMAYGKAKCG